MAGDGPGEQVVARDEREARERIKIEGGAAKAGLTRDQRLQGDEVSDDR